MKAKAIAIEFREGAPDEDIQRALRRLNELVATDPDLDIVAWVQQQPTEFNPEYGGVVVYQP